MKVSFPSSFSFGAATSGPQSEGGVEFKQDSIWDYWYKTNPEVFHNNVGPNVTCNTYNEYEKDVELMKECGLNSFRTSIQWSRIFNDFETLEINTDAIEFYTNYFKKIKEANIDLYVNLFHFDLPFYLQNTYDGFLSAEVVNKYVEFAKVCFKHFDMYVDKWITYNEPIAYTRSVYFDNNIYPNTKSCQKYVLANNNILISHMKTVEYYKANYNKEIGIVLDLLTPIIEDDTHLMAQQVYDAFINKIYLDPCIKGEYNEFYLSILKKHDIEIELYDNLVKMDFVGINYYQPGFVKNRETKYTESEFYPWYYFDAYIPEGVRINEHRGWAIEPKVVYNIAKSIQEEYGNIPWYLSENGMGVEGEEKYIVNGVVKDTYRTEFIEEHLYYLAKAINEGSNCFGYHLWTFIDCWSWKNSFKNRYGLVSLDLETREKTLKQNAYFYKDLAKNKYFTYEKN